LQPLCRLFGYSQQAFYKHQRTQFAILSKTQLIIKQVLHIRKHQPKCGGRKLLFMLQPFLKERNIQIGRDAFFDLLTKKQTAGPQQKNKGKHHQLQTLLLPLSEAW
jgi:putative transposase